MNNVCEICKKEFTIKRNTSGRFCSHSCAKSHTNKAFIGLYTHTCKICTKSFQHKSRNKSLCLHCEEIKWGFSDGKYIKKGRNIPSKYIMNPLILNDKEFVSYFLGFICSDGSVCNNHSISFWSTDYDIIHKITEKLQYTRNISVQDKSKVKGKPLYYNILYANNARLFFDLGLQQNKDLHDITKFNYDLDLFSFLRGFLDGDGSIIIEKTAVGIKLSRISLLCREILAVVLYEKLKMLGFNFNFSKVKKRQNNTKQLFTLSKSGSEGYNFLKSIYAGATIYLQRKYDIFKLIEYYGGKNRFEILKSQTINSSSILLTRF